MVAGDCRPTGGASVICMVVAADAVVNRDAIVADSG
jgi:hypothetical protein